MDGVQWNNTAAAEHTVQKKSKTDLRGPLVMDRRLFTAPRTDTQNWVGDGLHRGKRSPTYHSVIRGYGD